ncbi:MAG: hypothetical protein IJE78_15085 [Bacteroidaceae bacterium]|nr:hypothetical protein [Bacteroidaceae bacterium]
MMQSFGRERKVLVDVHEVIRYEDKSENIKTVEYTGCVGFEVVADAKRVAEIEAETDGSCIDDYHEYLILYFANGETSTFRNSYVDLFVI